VFEQSMVPGSRSYGSGAWARSENPKKGEEI